MNHLLNMYEFYGSCISKNKDHSFSLLQPVVVTLKVPLMSDLLDQVQQQIFSALSKQ